MGLGIVSDLGVGRGEEMSLEAGLEDGEGLRVTNMLNMLCYICSTITIGDLDFAKWSTLFFGRLLSTVTQ